MGTERLLKQAVFEMFENPKAGDLLMDAPSHKSWRELCTYAMDRDNWLEDEGAVDETAEDTSRRPTNK